MKTYSETIFRVSNFLALWELYLILSGAFYLILSDALKSTTSGRCIEDHRGQRQRSTDSFCDFFVNFYFQSKCRCKAFDRTVVCIRKCWKTPKIKMTIQTFSSSFGSFQREIFKQFEFRNFLTLNLKLFNWNAEIQSQNFEEQSLFNFAGRVTNYRLVELPFIVWRNF